jgi:hypothetical protein
MGAGSSGTHTTSVLTWPSALTSTGGRGIGGSLANPAGLSGFGSVPPKLIKRIVAREYMDIWELLPETWQVQTAPAATLSGHAVAW